MHHIPVMKDVVMTQLCPTPTDIIVDGTCGYGGHGAALLNALGPTGRYIGIDRDPMAVSTCQTRFSAYKNATIHCANFTDFPTLLQHHSPPYFTKFLLDLGVSSVQLDTPERGFSHRFNAPLDMRMNQTQSGLCAKTVLNTYSASALSDLFYTYGELRHNKKLVDTLITQRKKKPIEQTDDLKEAIKKSYFFRHKRALFMKTCSQVFQAIRIEVNQELQHLEQVLRQLELYHHTPFLAFIISFHSLEDTRIKHFVKHSPVLELVGNKAIKASKEERQKNSRSRSAVARLIRPIQTQNEAPDSRLIGVKNAT